MSSNYNLRFRKQKKQLTMIISLKYDNTDGTCFLSIIKSIQEMQLDLNAKKKLKESVCARRQMHFRKPKKKFRKNYTVGKHTKEFKLKFPES